jgi:hypothetical protein
MIVVAVGGFGGQALVIGWGICRQVWKVIGQVLWLQNCFLLFDEAICRQV